MSNKIVDDAEMDLVEEEAMEEKGTAYTIKLLSPVEFEGKKYSELTFDWYSLKGKDLMKTSRELASKGIVVVAKEFNDDFLLLTAARACTEKIGTDMLEELSYPDLNHILSRARSFLLRSAQ